MIGFLLVLGVACGQIAMPEKGWRLVEKGGEPVDGKQALGVWQNEDRTILVEAEWNAKMPELIMLFDLPPVNENNNAADAPPHWPEGAMMVRDPMVGFKIDFEILEENGMGKRQHYWIFGEKGGVFLKVFLKRDAEFDPRENSCAVR